MFRISFQIVMIGIGCLSSWALSSASAQIILSGDSTPVFSLTDSFPTDALPGNIQFFSNVLGSSTNVAVLESTNNLNRAAIELDEFFNSLAGVNSSLINGNISSTNLAGVELVVLAVPDNAFTANEISAIDDFLDNGGTAFLMGESTGVPNGAQTNAIVNDLLTGLGSELSLLDAALDIGTNIAEGAQIADHPLTSGVTEFRYGWASEVVGGDSLFFTLDGTPFAAVESQSIPEPSTAAFGFAIFCVAVIRRRKKQL